VDDNFEYDGRPYRSEWAVLQRRASIPFKRITFTLDSSWLPVYHTEVQSTHTEQDILKKAAYRSKQK